jgi:hypothetical protein
MNDNSGTGISGGRERVVVGEVEDGVGGILGPGGVVDQKGKKKKYKLGKKIKLQIEPR